MEDSADRLLAPAPSGVRCGRAFAQNRYFLHSVIRSASAAFLSVIAKGRLGDREANFEDIPACPSVFSFVSDEYSGDQSGTWILGC